jgi:hypothetical protein
VISGTAQMSATIDENDNYHILITGSNGSLEIVYEEQTSVKAIDNQQVSIYPNPTNGKINIETNEIIENITV